jgi:dephospho-CoA kinase
MVLGDNEMQKIMLGFASEMGAGKGTAADLIRRWFPGTESFRFSDSLREFYAQFCVLREAQQGALPLPDYALALQNPLRIAFGSDILSTVPPNALLHFAAWLSGEFVPRHGGVWPRNASTPDLQDISTKVREYFGEDVLERAIMVKAAQSVSQSPYVVVEGIRRLVDIGRLMHDPGNNFFLFYIETEVVKRHERHKKRNEKPGDADLTLAQFIKLGEAEAEQQIRLLKPAAHVVLDNNGTEEAFATKLFMEVTQCSVD